MSPAKKPRPGQFVTEAEYNNIYEREEKKLLEHQQALLLAELTASANRAISDRQVMGFTVTKLQVSPETLVDILLAVGSLPEDKDGVRLLGFPLETIAGMPFGVVNAIAATAPLLDLVNHPPHYRLGDVEVIDVTEQLDFCRGNAVKYIARAGRKEGSDERQDLLKAEWYLRRAISRLVD